MISFKRWEEKRMDIWIEIVVGLFFVCNINGIFMLSNQTSKKKNGRILNPASEGRGGLLFNCGLARHYKQWRG